MTSLTEALDRLAPTAAWEGDWPEVLRRAGEEAPQRRRRLGRRRAVILAFVVLAIVVPLTAVAAINHWWFLGAGSGLPRPLQSPTVVTHGSWSGHRWTLVAYASKGYGLCWGLDFAGKTTDVNGGMYTMGAQAAMRGDSAVGCGAIVGIQMPHLIASNLPTVMFEWTAGSTPRGYPGWISGAVASSATHVVIRWSAQKARPWRLASPRVVVRAATFPAPVAGYRVRLFAAPLRSSSHPTPALRASRRCRPRSAE